MAVWSLQENSQGVGEQLQPLWSQLARCKPWLHSARQGQISKEETEPVGRELGILRQLWKKPTIFPARCKLASAAQIAQTRPFPKTGRGKGNNKGNAHNGPHGKGKQDQGAAGQEGYYPIQGVAKGLPPEPPWRPTLPSMPSLPPLPPPSTPHPESKVVQTLNKLTAAIKKKPDQYDPEVHAILQSATLAEGLNAKDQMLQAAEVMGEAREALDAARLGRYQNHIRWRDFLASAVSRWQEYTSDFQKQEKEFHDAIEHSKAVMAEAKERFEVNKAALSEDDQLTYGGNVATDDPMAEKVQDNTSGKALQANLDQMAANLATLRTSAEASVLAEEQVTKRPRLSEGDGLGAPTAMPSSTAASHGSNAMQPFPVRTETQSFAEPGKV